MSQSHRESSSLCLALMTVLHLCSVSCITWFTPWGGGEGGGRQGGEGGGGEGGRGVRGEAGGGFESQQPLLMEKRN